MRFLGVDLGTRRVGLAVSDPDGIVATPVTTVERRSDRELTGVLAGIVSEYGIDEVIVGLPRTEAGDEAAAAAAARADAAALLGSLGVPVNFADERYTTRIATGALIDAGMRRSERRRVVDKLAAVVMLQGELDRRRNVEIEEGGER